ncbi:MerR family transcriptional regulator [Streptomyces sp. NPDC088258]|uniref:DNA polymerase III subunit beta family protein n=1 Tax=Streptomyces sp. NPDC088258 TaxID=3365849 RepID=UPI00381A64DC
MDSTTDNTPRGTGGTGDTVGGNGTGGTAGGARRGSPVDLTLGTPPELLSISVFARRVGLTPSALRFYDDCRVLPPARVDAATGYRSYSPDQAIRANMLRSLRSAGLPLADVMVVLDGEVAEARAVLERHRATVRERSTTADAAIAAVLRSMPGPDSSAAEAHGEPAPTRVRLGGAELAGAIRQVVPATGEDPKIPVLGRVLVEIDADEVRLVATDRYRLALRGLKPVLTVEGRARAVLIAAERLVEFGTWAARCAAVTLEAGPDGVRAYDTDGSGLRELPVSEGEFPAYREMLAALTPHRHRVIVGREALLTAVEALGDAPGVALRLGTDEVTVARPDGSGAEVLPAVRTGEPPLRIGFAPAVLVAALETSVGPDVLLEIAAPTEPVVVRSADQSGFTTLVMPVALAGRTD